MKAKVLYVEDDVNLGFVTKDNLEERGYEIIHCVDGEEGLRKYNEDKYDLCVLDVMLPKMDGFTLAKEIRKLNEHIPILFLTAKSQKVDRIEGLKTGADDYITKPFSIEELSLKMEVFLKRNRISNQDVEESVFSLNKAKFNYDQLSLENGDNIRQLTQREADLLKFFCKSPERLFKREEILLAVWGDDDYFLGRSLDVFISRLRKYLNGSASFENVHGVGFKMKIDLGE